MSQFLVMRRGDGKLASILVFDDEDPKALDAYEQAEHRGVDCCLFGADSILTLCKTHADWMDVPVRRPWPGVDPSAFGPSNWCA